MKDRGPDPRALPIAALCRDGASLTGQRALSDMHRLADSFAAASDGHAQWQLSAYTMPVAGGDYELWVHLQAQASVPLQCQRCLEAMAVELLVDRRIRFVRDEALAARLDAELEDDVMALTPRLDAHELLQDELILALPLVPRHEGTCPQTLPTAAPAQDSEPEPTRANPFAVLADLATKAKSGGKA